MLTSNYLIVSTSRAWTSSDSLIQSPAVDQNITEMIAHIMPAPGIELKSNGFSATELADPCNSEDMFIDGKKSNTKIR